MFYVGYKRYVVSYLAHLDALFYLYTGLVIQLLEQSMHLGGHNCELRFVGDVAIVEMPPPPPSLHTSSLTLLVKG